ncbi:hypothetical protein ACP8HI_12520 [Paenibacillus sp. FA6]|uniref:hypothetical protein n=1 Tax=Paenibacillus sp. FA6 TaxID=3413029 RepID=UPI003F65C004
MSHQDHMTLETIVRGALGGVSRRGMVVADADFTELEGGAFSAFVAALAPYYINASNDRQSTIHELVSRYSHLSGTKVGGEVASQMARDLRSFFDTQGIELNKL